MSDTIQTGPPAARQARAEETSFAEYVTILLDEWRLVAAAFVAVLFCAGIYLAMAVPRYMAWGVIQVSTSESGDAAVILDLVSAGRPSPIQTEVEILRSRRIVGKAIREMSLVLDQDIPAFTLDFSVSIGGKSPLDPNLRALRRSIRGIEVADWMEEPVKAVFTLRPDGSLAVQREDEASAVIVTKDGLYDHRGIRFRFEPVSDLKTGKPITVAIQPEDLAVERTLEDLSVSSVGGQRNDTSLVRVAYEAADRTLARDFVNAVMDAYVSFALEWRTSRADRSASFIEGQLSAIRDSLEASEKELQTFVESQGAVALPDQARELIRAGAEFDLEFKKVQIQEDMLAMVVSEISRASRTGQSPALTGNFVFEDKLLGDAIGALNELELKRETLLADMTETHPQVVRLGEEIRRVREQVLDLVKAARERIAERRRSMSAQLDQIRERLLTFPDKERQMAAITRDLQVSQELYTFLMTKLEESRIVKASTTTDKRIIDGANTPWRRSSPRRALTLVFAAVLGLLLGVSLVFARRAIDPTVRDEEEAKSLSGLPVYGAVPDLRVIGLGRGKEPVLERIWETPKGPGAEAFRTIRTNVEFAQVGDQPIRVIQITSSEASEGKSTVLANLAVALSKAGHRVLVLDLDLRKPTQHRIWSVARAPGISDHVVGRADLSVRRNETFGVDVISAGNEPPESQRLLASARLAELIASWREMYDYVLLDTPPLLVADSLVVSRLSDMVLFVVRPRRCHRTSLKLAQTTHRRMTQIKGMVINGVATRRGGYYHYYRGSYYGSKTSDTQET